MTIPAPSSRGRSGQFAACILVGLAVSPSLATAQQAQPIETLALREVFGVSHPDQIVDFDLARPAQPGECHVLGPGEVEVPFQLLEGGRKLAVRTDLPAGAERVWRLMPGESGLAPGKEDVTVTAQGGLLEIANSLLAIRVPAGPGPAGVAAGPALAPLQGVRYRDGTWSGLGPDPVRIRGRIKRMHVTFIERGPLVAVVEVKYLVDRPAYRYGQQVYKEAGEGFYSSTIELQAAQPSVLIEEDGDVGATYSLDLYRGLRPDEARYRGHHSTKVQYGRESDGRQYRPTHERPSMDAFVEIAYDRARASSYLTDNSSWRRMAVWDPWIYDGGFYWMLYNRPAAEKANLLGIFAGRPSRALGAANSGTGIFTSPGRGGAPSAGLTVALNLRSPDARVFPRVRYQWGLFVGTKADLRPPTAVQPVNWQMNLRAGFNLSKISRYVLDCPDPASGFGGMYMDRSAVQRVLDRLRKEPRGAYYKYLYDADGYTRGLVDMWADASGAKCQAVVDDIVEEARNLLDVLANREGCRSFHYAYWHGGLALSRRAIWIDQVLASDRVSAEDKKRIKAAAALFGYVLWDDDHTPLLGAHGLNLGTANMPVQQQSYRDLYAMMLASHPAMRQRAADVPQRLSAMLHGTINESGSHMASMHYVGASNGPLMSAMQQLKQTGLGDLFAANDRMAGFGEFYLNALTPPEVRFGKVRKLIAIGDGSTEGTEAFGQLATALAGTRPQLSARLMDAWRQNGRVHSSFHGTTFVKIDEDLPGRPAVLGNATFDGYYSVLRNAWDTPDETAVWVINGEFYRDHRHDDRGQVVIYALGAPLALDWGSTYSPHVPGSFLHNMVVPASSLKHPWDEDSPPLSGGSGWRESRQAAFLAFGASAHAVSSFRQREQITWTRSVTSIHPRADRPILVIRDTFEGPQAAAAKVATLCLAADGDVHTPGGEVSPAPRTHKGGSQGELPSAGKPFALPKGVSRLQFTGQNWPAHPTKGIDWDLYVIAERDQQALIGNWAHCWHPGRETSEFRRANGRAFEERQHILRVKGTGGFTMLLLPFPKGARSGATVELDGDVIAVAAGTDVMRIAPSWWSVRAEGETILAALDARAVSAGEVSIRGGPAEVAVRKDRARITIHGAAGVRGIKLPGTWRTAGPKDERVSIAREGGTWNVNLKSPGEPVTVELTAAR